jgi:hypothetical protein
MPPPTWLQELAAIGDFLAGITLFLLVWIFIRDRRVADRAQIDQFAAWIEWDSDLERPPGEPFYVNVRVLLRNVSKLPIEIIHVGVDIRARWTVEDLQAEEHVAVSKPVEGTEKPTFMIRGVRLAPNQTYEQNHRQDMSHHAPARPVLLWPDGGIVCKFRSILVIDNAGRRWRVRPGQAGSAERVPWGRKPKDELEPRYWSEVRAQRVR